MATRRTAAGCDAAEGGRGIASEDRTPNGPFAVALAGATARVRALAGETGRRPIGRGVQKRRMNDDTPVQRRRMNGSGSGAFGGDQEAVAYGEEGGD
jgi:hypothetical protein